MVVTMGYQSEAPAIGRYVPAESVCRFLGITCDLLLKEFEQGTLKPYLTDRSFGVFCAIAEIEAPFKEGSIAEARKRLYLTDRWCAPLVDEHGYIPWAIALDLMNIPKSHFMCLVDDVTIRSTSKTKKKDPERRKLWVMLSDVLSWMDRRMTHAGQQASMKSRRTSSRPPPQVRTRTSASNRGFRTQPAPQAIAIRSNPASLHDGGIGCGDEGLGHLEEGDHADPKAAVAIVSIDGLHARPSADDLTLSRTPTVSSHSPRVDDLTLSPIGVWGRTDTSQPGPKAFEDAMLLDCARSRAQYERLTSSSGSVSDVACRSPAFWACGHERLP
jgi:hypothetical protein